MCWLSPLRRPRPRGNTLACRDHPGLVGDIVPLGDAPLPPKSPSTMRSALRGFCYAPFLDAAPLQIFTRREVSKQISSVAAATVDYDQNCAPLSRAGRRKPAPLGTSTSARLGV